jgi:allophanate hydrolase
LTAFATPRSEDLEFCGDETQAESFRAALLKWDSTGGRRIAVDFRPFREVGALLYEGPWLAERLAGLEEFLKTHAADVHPVTRTLLMKGTEIRGVDVFRGNYRLAELRALCLEVFKQAEVMIVPTMPTIPTLAEVKADSIGWSSRLGTYTNFVNLLGLAALAVPAGFTSRGLPAGVTLIGPAGSDGRLCELAMAWQRNLDLPLGATRNKLPPTVSPAPATTSAPAANQVRVSVAGAHLRGQPLHPALLRFGARFVRACRTAPLYRFMAFLDLDPPRPGLMRDEDRAGALDVEIFDLPMEGFGRLVASVAPPLAIGTVALEDGEMVKGFLCEAWAARRARDITDFGAWLAFLASRKVTAHSTTHDSPPSSPKGLSYE